MDKIIEYAPVIIIVLIFLFQQHLVVTPEQLERKHREILKDIQTKFDNLNKDYVTLSAYLGFREQVLKNFEELKSGIDDIRNYIINGDIKK